MTFLKYIFEISQNVEFEGHGNLCIKDLSSNTCLVSTDNHPMSKYICQVVLCASRDIPELSNNKEGELDYLNSKKFTHFGKCVPSYSCNSWGSTETVSSLMFLALVYSLSINKGILKMATISFPVKDCPSCLI